MSKRPSLVGALVALVVWTAVTVGGGLLQASGPASLDELVSSGVVWAIPLAGLSLLVAYRSRFSELGLVAPSSLGSARLPAIAVAILLLLAAFNGLPAVSVLALLAINSLFVGVSEELMFRGVLLRALLGRSPVRRAALMSALAFGAIHSLNALFTGEAGAAIAQSLIAVGMGLWAASLRIRTGSLLAPIVLHALWDLALLAVISGPEGSSLALVASVTAIVFAIGLGSWGWRTIGAFERQSGA